ncbi:MAG: DUF1800 domain-containing protein [Pseudomonadota bacterium]
MVFTDTASTARFLHRATFGPGNGEAEALTGTLESEWFLDQVQVPASLYTPIVNDYINNDELSDPGLEEFLNDLSPRFAFLQNSINGEDQLRQRVAFALSQIIVVSVRDDVLFDNPTAVAYFQDILVRNAFGNYRDLLEEVTYSPAMGFYLTYIGNQKGDPMTGRVPDENYAREIMQLFTIGLVELQQNGQPVTGSDGRAVETYTNADITGLAKVFTGLGVDNGFFPFSFLSEPASIARPMIVYPEHHSEAEKVFLDVTIPAGTSGEQSIGIALDALVDHPNTAPFISRQLIQRLVTSNPSDAYVGRVAGAFASGSYALPDGTVVGDERRGDLTATVAAILFDDDAIDMDKMDDPAFGKVREPVLRFINWARAFDAGGITPEYLGILFDTSRIDTLSQQAYGSPSVFNFYRPGYIAPGTETGAAGLTAPELQIVNPASVAGYTGFMQYFIQQFQSGTTQDNEFATVEQTQSSFSTDYTAERALAGDPAALIEHLDMLLTYGAMSSGTRDGIINALENIPLTSGGDGFDPELFRVQMAILLTMTSPDYLVQR